MPKWNVAVHFSRIQTNKLVVHVSADDQYGERWHHCDGECSRGVDFRQQKGMLEFFIFHNKETPGLK
ncbi:hypothetical protein Q8G35_03505 [Peribacillus simplex]|uniref:Uncharacterized protein n=2 Tax=Peribacillus TaxID=2675229 RepID=A0AA90P8Y6_9BACI|nr:MULTISPECIES: hypothetical protein [Peribacillus]MDP1417471.1 hypothetical protein [Peribacillus simplex]MDP1450126.1 hypothetical protein [Peribacillus frigoritolerans]